MAPKVETLKKITTKTVLPDDFDPKKFVAEKPAADLYVVYGVARDVKTGSTQYGPYYKLFGMFEAVRLADDQKFTSSFCILPEPFGSLIGQKVHSLVGGNDKDASAKFAMTVGIRKKGNAIGYEWTSTPMVEESVVDALAEVRKSVSGLLAAPKK